MPRKKKNKSAAAKKQQGKDSKAKSKSVRKPSPKKEEVEILPVLNAEKLKELYAMMVKCRMLAERTQNNSTEIKTDNSVCGFEAVLIGAGAHLFQKDSIATEHSSVVASLIKGTPLQDILAGDKEDGPERRNGNPMPVLSMETVLAFVAEMKGQGSVMLMFCTRNSETLVFDSATMAVAATQKLPLVCLVESSLDSPLELPNQVASGPYIGADPAFYPRIPVDGCDVVGVFRVTQEAIRRAREGHGPAVIECLTTRSSTAEKNMNGQASAQYLAQDPLSFMEQYLRRRDLWSDIWPNSIIQEFSWHLSEASSSPESPSDIDNRFDNVNSPHPAAASAR